MKNLLRALALLAGSAFAAAAMNVTQAATLPLQGWSATQTKAHALPAAATDNGALPATEKIHVAVALQLRDRPVLTALTDARARDRSTPALTPRQFLDRHAPTSEQATRVANHLRAYGFDHVEIADNRLLVTADGTAAQIQAAFQVELHAFDVDGRRAFANVTDVSVPAALSDTVLSVIGLQTVTRVHPLSRRVEVQATAPQAVVGIRPPLFASLYGAAGMASATTATIGIITQGSMTQTLADLNTFAANAGYPAPNVSVVTVGNASTDTSGIDEWNLDTQTSLAAAGGTIKSMLLYTATTLNDANVTSAYNKAVSDNLAQVINVSLGECETSAKNAGVTAANDQIFQTAVAQGQTFSVASGDSGSYECGGSTSQQSYPAVSPYVMSIGGTTLSSSGGTWVGETVWSCTSATNCANSGGTGGGVSSTEAAPSWQTAAGVLTTAGRRGVPDIAFDASPSSGALILVNGSNVQIGGTSLSAPLFTGFYSRVQTAHGNTLGFPAPALYANAASNASWFHDVVSGSNGGYSAGTGWDYVTGYGSLQVQNFSSNFSTGSGGGGATSIATENQTFTLNGLQNVRYGYGSSWLVATLNGGGTCSNGSFGGDPLSGTVKHCEIVASTPVNWTTVAAENQSFTVSGTQAVRYGSGSSWVTMNVSGNAACSNGYFGTDPLVGTVKQCQLASTASITWLKIAAENQSFGVTQARTVRYGAGSAWITQTVTTSGNCTNAAFTDPVVGTVKECDLASP